MSIFIAEGVVKAGKSADFTELSIPDFDDVSEHIIEIPHIKALHIGAFAASTTAEVVANTSSSRSDGLTPIATFPLRSPLDQLIGDRRQQPDVTLPGYGQFTQW